MPVVAARLPLVAVHALLHHGPMAVVGDEKPVQIKVEAVLHGRTVHFGDEAAGAGEGSGIEADTVAERGQLIRRLARVLAPAATDMDAEFALQGCEPALERADDARRDAGRMPVHAHDRTEGLKPEGVRQPPQEFVAAVVMHDRLAHDGAQRGHALPQPRRHTPAMEGKISAACPSCH